MHESGMAVQYRTDAPGNCAHSDCMLDIEFTQYQKKEKHDIQ
jgi:hypothetical protein